MPSFTTQKRLRPSPPATLGAKWAPAERTEEASRGAAGHDLSGVPVHMPVAAEDSQISVPAAMRAQFERVTRLPVDLVRLHVGPESQHAAQVLHAQAFTLGRDIHFAAGAFAPGTPDGDRLLAHELVHTQQQRAGIAAAPQLQSLEPEPDALAEFEADSVADKILKDDEEAEVPVISQRPAAVRLAPKKKKKAAAAKPVTFKLFSTTFKATVDAANAVTVKALGPAHGWKLTSTVPNTVEAERTIDRAAYTTAKGVATPFVQRCTITVPQHGAATLTPIVAELNHPPTLSVVLSGDNRAAARQSVVVNGATLQKLDLPATAIAFTPADGDTIHFGLKSEAWVFTTLHEDIVPPATTAHDVTGFFEVGSLELYNDHHVPTLGINSPGTNSAQTFDDLADPHKTAQARRITADEAAMYKTIRRIEANIGGVQTYDSGILSFGFAQWTVNSDLPRMLNRLDQPTFERYLGRYGLTVAAPVRQLDANVHKFIAGERERERLGRNVAEFALFLNNKELVKARLLQTAAAQSTVLDAAATAAAQAKADLDAAKPDLHSSDAVRRAAAQKTAAAANRVMAALQPRLRGLAGMKPVQDPAARAALFQLVAATGKAAADDTVKNCAASEVLRGEEWALRFEMLGQSAGAQDAEIAEIRANLNDASSKRVAGTDVATLLPHLRGKAALLSSYLNSHAAIYGERRDDGSRKGGLPNALRTFKARKQKQAKDLEDAAIKAKLPAPAEKAQDWKDFPWVPGDARWTRLWTDPVIDEFESLAIVQLTEVTTDPKGRRARIKHDFP